MLKNLSSLQHKVGDKIYHLICDQDSPLEHVKESLFQFLKYCGQVEDQIKAQEEQKKLDEQPAAQEDSKVEEMPQQE